MNIYGETGLCALAKRCGKSSYKPEWTLDTAKREAAQHAYYVLSQGRRSKATKRYFTAIMDAYMEGVYEVACQKEQKA